MNGWVARSRSRPAVTGVLHDPFDGLVITVALISSTALPDFTKPAES